MNRPQMEGLRLNAPAHVKHARLIAWVAEIAALTEAISRACFTWAGAFRRKPSICGRFTGSPID